MTVISDLKQKVSKLDILINCVQHIHNPAMANDEAIDTAQAAINKATGGQK